MTNPEPAPHPLSPPVTDDPRPWEKGGVALAGNWAEVMKACLDNLSALEDIQTHTGNRLFLHRLSKDLHAVDLKLPAFPTAVKSVDHLMKRDRADAFKFSQLLETDEALPHAVWYQANSVQYSRPVNSLKGAIARLSQDNMWRLISRVGIESAVWRVPHMTAWVDAQRMHGVIVAEVAAHLEGERRCTSYIGGLLHGIGRLSIYRAAVRHRQGPAPAPEFVDKLCAQLYPTIGVLIARAWDLEPSVVAAIGFHNAPASAPESSKKVSWLVYLANIIGHTVAAEAEGLDSDGRDVIASMKDVHFDADEAFDIAHDALSECEAYHAAQLAEAEKQQD